MHHLRIPDAMIESRLGTQDDLAHLTYVVHGPSNPVKALCGAWCIGWRIRQDAVVTCVRCVARAA